MLNQFFNQNKKMIGGIFTALVLGGSLVYAQSDLTESFLLEKEKQEISDRARAEALAKESQKEQERLNQRRRDLAARMSEIQRRKSELQAKQMKSITELRAIENENRNLKTKEINVVRELEIVEHQAKMQEAETLKIKTQLDTTKAKLLETIAKLEQKRQETKDKIEADKLKVANWTNQIANTQNEIVKSDLMRMDYDKSLAKIDVQTAEIERKLQDSIAERDSMNQDLDAIKARHLGASNRIAELNFKLKEVEAEKAKLANEIKSAENNYLAENEQLTKKTRDLENAKFAAEQQRLNYIAAQKNSDELLRKFKEKNQEVASGLADSLTATAQARMSYMKSREDLSKQVLESSKLLKSEVKDLTVPTMSIALTKSEFSGNENEKRDPANTQKKWQLIRLCHLMDRPDFNAVKQKKLPAGTEVEIFGMEGRFYKAVDSTGQPGYILNTCGR